MNSEQDSFEAIEEKVKSSPYWRNDFKLIEEKKEGTITVYRVQANDQEPSTILAIAKLNEILKR
tara:strand:+ start:85647 stop:85838 length:192 start_codon:yes stop_codon:yes gene_type:complete